MGRPKLEIDEGLVVQLAKIHCTHTEIAAVVGCSVDTLTRRFADIIEKAREDGKSSLRRAQWKAALSGDRTLMIWLGKQHLGQNDKQQHEVSGPEGGPLQIMVTRRVIPPDADA